MKGYLFVASHQCVSRNDKNILQSKCVIVSGTAAGRVRQAKLAPFVTLQQHKELYENFFIYPLTYEPKMSSTHLNDRVDLNKMEC